MQKLISALREANSNAIHIESDAYVVAPSSIPNAGNGLFVGKDLAEGVFFIEYTGKVLNFQQVRQIKDRSYIKAASINTHIDASDPLTSSAARFINDHPDPSKRNCKFVCDKGRVYVKTSRAVVKGEEFFVEYGRGHWLCCEYLEVAAAFLSVNVNRTSPGVVATSNLESGVFLCTYSSLHWDGRFGPGIGIAIRKSSKNFPLANCKLQKNPLLRGTTFVQALTSFVPGLELIMEKPILEEKVGQVGFYVTGFGKFRGVPENPTTKLVGNLRPYEGELCILGSNILETSIPGVKNGLAMANQVLKAQYTKGKNLVPETIMYIHFGVNGGAERFQLELIARNCANFAIPDERGLQPRDQAVCGKDGSTEVMRCTSLDLEDVLERMKKRGHDVEISHDAGDYICNYAYYSSLMDITPSEWGHDESLFVHVPALDVANEREQLKFACDLLKVIAEEVVPSRNAASLRI
jgi:pyroglutamyl-peptidase